MSLTRRTLILVALTAALAILGLWSGEDPTLHALWKLPAALLLLGLAIESILSRRDSWHLTTTVPERAYLGRATEVAFELQASARPLQLELARTTPSGVRAASGIEQLQVAAGGCARASFAVTPITLGRLDWPAIPARILGFFGLGWWPRRIETHAALEVVPDALQRSGRARALTPAGAYAQAAHSGGAEVEELRDYRPGDPLRAIDWKASARAQHLIARELAQDQHLEVMLALDAGRTSAIRAGALDRLGQRVNVLARLAEHVIGNDDRVGLVVFADRPLSACAPMRGTAAVRQVRAALTTLRPQPQEANVLAATMRVRSLCRQRALVVFMTDLDDAAAGMQLAHAVRFLMPKHLPLVAGIVSPELERLSHAPGERWLDPFVSLAAQEQLGRIRGNVAALRALGVPVVCAPAERVERAVFATYAELRRRRRI